MSMYTSCFLSPSLGFSLSGDSEDADLVFSNDAFIPSAMPDHVVRVLPLLQGLFMVVEPRRVLWEIEAIPVRRDFY